MAINNVTIVDVQSHVYEPDAIWEKYLAPEYRVAARSAFYHRYDPATGNATVILNGKSGKPMNRSKINRQAIWKPGMTPQQIGGLDPRMPHPINPAAQDPHARLRDMDTLGIDRAILYPTVFAEYFPIVESPDVAYALARAYNDWVFDFAAADRKRLIPAMVLPMQEPTFAVEELQRNAKRGFRAISIRPAFYEGRFLNHPLYDTFWSTAEGLGLAAMVYASPGSTNPEWSCVGSFLERVALNLNIGHNVAETCAPMLDLNTALQAFLQTGHMEDYPKLKLGFIGGGAPWVTIVLEKMEGHLPLSFGVRDICLEPEETFLGRPSLVQWNAYERGPARMHDIYQHFTAWGSSYPWHTTTTPQEALETLSQYGVPGDAVAKMMGGNAAKFIDG